MTETTTREAVIEADPNLPTIRIVREFAAPRERVYRAWADPEVFVQWMGPKGVTLKLHDWELRTGGHWRYSSVMNGQEVASFYGSFHEVRPNDRIVQTFTWEGAPDGVSLDTAFFEDVDGGTRVTLLSVVESLEIRDQILSSGMEVGINDGYAKLDELLAKA